MDYCKECEFDYQRLSASQVSGYMQELALEYRNRLDIHDDDQLVKLRAHHEEGVWTALEYACHVRDVLVVQHDRLLLALATGEDPQPFVPMGRDERAVSERYNEQPPRDVAVDLVNAAEVLSESFSRLTPEQWGCPAIYSDGRHIDILWLGRHTAHELHHHLMDMDRQLG